jgi:hypothetical protein
MKTFRYNFEQVEKCEMCGSDTSNHKILGLRTKTGMQLTVYLRKT